LDAKEEFGDVEEVLEGAHWQFIMSEALHYIMHDYVLNNVAFSELFVK